MEQVLLRLLPANERRVAWRQDDDGGDANGSLTQSHLLVLLRGIGREEEEVEIEMQVERELAAEEVVAVVVEEGLVVELAVVVAVAVAMEEVVVVEEVAVAVGDGEIVAEEELVPLNPNVLVVADDRDLVLVFEGLGYAVMAKKVQCSLHRVLEDIPLAEVAWYLAYISDTDL